MTQFTTSRRKVLLGALATALVAPGCALEDEGGGSETTKSGGKRLEVVEVGFLHTVAVDSHLWLGMADGIFEKHGLRIEPKEFGTGVAESQALSGGSVDVAIMGAVLSNFPAQGGSKIFLANNVEYNTAQLWVGKGSGIESVKDLEGKDVLTTEGTTAHVFLHTALKQNGVDPGSVRVVNSEMPAAVTGFISGAAPAVALWVPFDEQVEAKAAGSKMIDSAKSYYPDAAILGGWAASTKTYEQNPELLEKLTAAWLDINHELVSDPKAAMRKVHEQAYAEDQSFDDTYRQYEFSRLFDNDRWAELYRDGGVADWIGQVEKVFVEVGGLPEYRDPKEFFDPKIYLKTYESWSEENS